MDQAPGDGPSHDPRRRYSPVAPAMTPVGYPQLRCGSTPVPGVNETPRSTSANCAVRRVTKDSLAGRVSAAKSSVIMTSLFGPAPWSPLPLTIDVIAQIVTVPSRLTRPVRVAQAVGRG